jgi:TonB family protein
MTSGIFIAVFLVGASVAVGQDASSPAPSSPQTETISPAAKVYDVGADVVSPVLVPMQWQVIVPDTCKEPKEGLVSLVLVVDADGVPRDISVAGPQGTTLEKMALRIVGADRFKPGTFKGEPVAVRWMSEVTVKGCFVTKTDDAGNTSDVFRLTAQPVQEFGATARQKKSAQIASAIAALPPEPGLYKVGNGVSPPVALNHVEAKFSEEARYKHIEGVCLISMIVDAQGKPQNARVIRSLGYGLDEKAIEAVNKYKFKPAMKEGVPVPVRIAIEVNFRLYEKVN